MKSRFIVDYAFQLPRFLTELPGCKHAFSRRERPPELAVGLLFFFPVAAELDPNILALAIHGFHQGIGFIFSTQNVEFAKSNPLGLNFGGNWWGSAITVLGG